jgi:hypothetical protein
MSAKGPDAPGETWCSWHLAPFRFFPNPALDLEAIREGVRSRCLYAIDAAKSWRDTKQSVYVEADENIFQCSGNQWKLKINYKTGVFSLGRAVSSEIWSMSDYIDGWIINGQPDDFLVRLAKQKPKGILDDEYTFLKDWVSMLLINGDDDVRRALQSGAAEIMAQPGSLLSPFVAIHTHAWAGAKICIRENPESSITSCYWDAELADGSKIYSLHLRPTSIIVEARLPKSGPEIDCFKWLRGLMKANPVERPEGGKSALQALAMSQFNISGKSFGRAWDKAVEATGASWKQGGRPRKKPETKTLTPN